MARLRQAPAVPPGGLPVELTSRHHECWEDPAAVARLAAAHGLTLTMRHQDRSLTTAPWWARFDAFRDAWCKANGLMNPQYPQTLDWRRATAAGVDMSASSRYRLRPNEGRDVAREGA